MIEVTNETQAVLDMVRDNALRGIVCAACTTEHDRTILYALRIAESFSQWERVLSAQEREATRLARQHVEARCSEFYATTVEGSR